MKSILLPTDLSVQSLWPIQKLAENAGGEKINIYLLHVLCMPSDFYELLGIGKSNPRALASQNFIEAYEMLHNKHKSTINKLNFDFIYGSSKRVVINYMQGHGIDEICILSNFFYDFKLKESVDFIAYLKQSKLPVRNIPLQIDSVAAYQTFSTLLNGNNGLKEIVRTNKRPVFSDTFEN